VNSYAQISEKGAKQNGVSTEVTTKANGAAKSTSLELAKAAVVALGGEKFRLMKTLVIRGNADIIVGGSTQVLPSAFSTVYAGEKYRIDLQNAFRPFQQIFDGQQTYSSLGGNFSMPPLNRLGLPLLAKIQESGFIVSEVPNSKKKENSFRITSPEGYYTDFFLDEKNHLLKSYESRYNLNGYEVTTAVALDKFRDVEGVSVPENYSQRFELGQITVYANFKAKEILVNSAVADDVFAMPAAK
jgi:hypothetical protein